MINCLGTAGGNDGGSSLSSWLQGNYVRGNCTVLNRSCWWSILLTSPKLKPVVYAFPQVSLTVEAVNFMSLCQHYLATPMFLSLSTAVRKLTISVCLEMLQNRKGSTITTLKHHVSTLSGLHLILRQYSIVEKKF